MTNPFFKETVEVMKEIAPMWRMWDMHAIMRRLREAYQLKKPLCFKIREDTPDNMQSMLSLWQHNPEGVCFGTRAKTVVFKAKTLQP